MKILDVEEEEKRFREWCRIEQIDPGSLCGLSVWRGWVQGQISLINQIAKGKADFRESYRQSLDVAIKEAK